LHGSSPPPPSSGRQRRSDWECSKVGAKRGRHSIYHEGVWRTSAGFVVLAFLLRGEAGVVRLQGRWCVLQVIRSHGCYCCRCWFFVPPRIALKHPHTILPRQRRREGGFRFGSLREVEREAGIVIPKSVFVP